MSRVLTLPLFVLSLCFFFHAQGELEARPHAHCQLDNEPLVRPPRSNDLFGYGAEKPRSFKSPGGKFKVWWVDKGRHAPSSLDMDKDGIPDFVQLVASIADETYKRFDRSVWRAVIPDKDQLNNPDDYGGDERFDIFVVDFSGGDGKYSNDNCVKAGEVFHCVGHMLVKNDFTNTGYSSVEEAIKVIVSHEYFHAIQASYVNNLPAWWSEGTATWFEEVIFPSQLDFERLANQYFKTPERSLNSRTQGPFDSFAYGSSLFVYFLSLKWGQRGIADVFVKLSEGMPVEKALEWVAKKNKTTLEQTFLDFSVFNVFTGTRTIKDKGYPGAARFNKVPMKDFAVQVFNWDLANEPLSAKFGRLVLKGPVTLTVKALESFPPSVVLAVSEPQWAKSGKVHRLTASTPVHFAKEDSPVYLVVANGTFVKRSIRVQVRKRKTLPPSPPTLEPSAEPVTKNDGGSGTRDAANGEQTSPGATSGCQCDASLRPPASLSLICMLLWVSFVLRRRNKARKN